MGRSTGRMMHEPITKPAQGKGARQDRSTAVIHPAWLALIRYCRELGYGEIAQLKIQDGIPVLAEEIRQKVKFV